MLITALSASTSLAQNIVTLFHIMLRIKIKQIIINPLPMQYILRYNRQH